MMSVSYLVSLFSCIKQSDCLRLQLQFKETKVYKKSTGMTILNVAFNGLVTNFYSEILINPVLQKPQTPFFTYILKQTQVDCL